MSEVLEQEAKAGAAHAQKYTRNNPYQSNVNVNYLLTAEGSEKETRHVELSLEEGMTYTPGDAVGIIPENRAEAVADALKALGYSGSERVLDHYKVEISLEEALRTSPGHRQAGTWQCGAVCQAGSRRRGAEGSDRTRQPRSRGGVLLGSRVRRPGGRFPRRDYRSAAVVQRTAAVDPEDVFDLLKPEGASGQRSHHRSRDPL